MVRFLLVALTLALGGCRSGRLAQEEPHEGGHEHEHEHEHGHELERPPPFGVDLRCGWLARAEHVHRSRCGTPYVHAFHVEPAFLGRDLLVHAEHEGDEHALEVEAEFALTRRLLAIAELPYHWTDDEDGLGDLGLGLRGLLIETDRFLLSTQAAIELETAEGALGAGEAVLAASVLAWADLGSWFTAQAGVTFEVGADTGDSEVSWGVVLGKSFACRPFFGCSREEHGHGSVLTLFLEGRGTHGLSGPEEGASTYEALLGISVPVTEGLDARVGWTLLWEDEDEPDAGWVAGFVVHL